jgi:hypothetical protein
LKKISIILLIFVLAIGQFGYYCFYAYRIYCAKELAKEQLLKQIPSHLLIKISANDNPSIHWEEENEISLDNKMYDVVRVEVESGKQYLLCISDENEDVLLKKFSGIVVSNKDEGNNTGKNQLVLKFQVNDIICSSYNELFRKNIAMEDIHGIDMYTPGLCFTDRNVNTPPPKI